MTHEITIQNVGAIAHITIPLSEEGGVITLTGPNGCGKSTALDTVSTLASGRGKLPPLRDGQTKGLVAGFGSKIDLRMSGSRRGGGKPELIVESIEGKFSIADLVDPGILDPKAADKARMKAYITLSGACATADLFVPLFKTKEEFERHVSQYSIDTSDPIVMYERVKRDIEENARMEEQRAQKAFAEHSAMTVGAEYDPADIIDDKGAYYDELDAANATLNQLTAASESYRTVMASVEEAREVLARCDVAAKEKLIEDERAAIAHRTELNDEAEIQIKILRRQIAELEGDIPPNLVANTSSERLIRATQAELDSLEGYKNIVAQAESVTQVDAAELEAAKEAVDVLRSKLDLSAVAKENRRKQSVANEMLYRAEAIRDSAVNLRETARRCDVILTELIGSDSPLRVIDGRMVVDTKRGETFYSDLSDGERWRVAFEVVAQHVNRDPDRVSVITIPQIGWESLDPANQKQIAKLAKRYKINVITAEATDGELTVQKTE